MATQDAPTKKKRTKKSTNVVEDKAASLNVPGETVEKAWNAAATNKPAWQLKASENGTDINEYAKRVYNAQTPDLPETFKLRKVEDSLKNQGWTMQEIAPVVEGMCHS